MTYYIQISTTNWPKDRLLFEDTMSTLEKLCDVQNGCILNEPVSKFGWTFIDMILKGDFHMSMEQEFTERTVTISTPSAGAVLTILVENMGRSNYGSRLADRKGITDCVMLGEQILFGWTIYPLPLDDLSRLEFRTDVAEGYPTFYRGTFWVDSPEDSFLLPAGWSKGICWINGFNIGRYWKRGPQQTLYVPKPLFQQGNKPTIDFIIK